MGADEFKGFKLIESHPFSEGQFNSLVQHTSPNPPRFSGPAMQDVQGSALNVGKLLTRLNCATILVEQHYIDRDFKAEFSAFYSKRFSLPSADCTRLHFFSARLADYGEITNPEQIDSLAEGASYLGFCVVRPTEFFRIGRTVIKFIPQLHQTESKTYYVTCQSQYTAHLLGREFKVLGMPFIQQDTQVGACAHAALWMVGRYMHSLRHCGEISIQQINLFAKSRQSRGRHYPAQDGLAPTQMLDALHEMGLFAIFYDDFDPNKFNKPYSSRLELISSLIYFYVESGFPVIIGFQQHVIVAIGHTLNTSKFAFRNLGDRIPSFLIHDDLIEPYGEFPLSGNKIYRMENVRELIAVLPSSVHLQGEYAEILARVLMDQLASKDDPLIIDCQKDSTNKPLVPSTYRLRTYLMKATDFLIELQTAVKNCEIPRGVGNLLLRMEFPIYVWVSEIFSLKGGPKEKCIGKFLFDSTAAAWDKSVIAILLENIVFLFNRRDLEEIPLIHPLADELEFSPRELRAKT